MTEDGNSSNSVRAYYESQSVAEIGVDGAGLIWFLGRDHLSPSYDNSDEIALHPDKWRDGARLRCLNLANNLNLSPHSSVLDIGAGIGGPARDIGAEFGCSITSLNLAFNQLLTAQKLSSQSNLPQDPIGGFVQGDAQAIPLADSCFDAVYSINAFYHISELHQALIETARVLKPFGRFGLDDWFISDAGDQEALDNLRYRWSSPDGFHSLTKTVECAEATGFQVIDQDDFTEEAARFLTEERFGAVYDSKVAPCLLENFPNLYPDCTEDHAKLAVLQLRKDILYMGELYQAGRASYCQLIFQKG